MAGGESVFGRDRRYVARSPGEAPEGDRRVEFREVGGTKSITVDTRTIAATNKDLAANIRERKFREDLFYRVNVVSIHLPPLRERKRGTGLAM
jgi:sigma54-dependent transcription regulator